MSGAASSLTPSVICVLGMHRSGTSVVSRLLNILGVYLGPERAISNVGSDNPKGYWEHHPIALLNDEILTRVGGRWDEPPVFHPGWVEAPEVAELQDKAREILTDFAGHALWGWKDPRTCLTLPFWQDLAGPIRYVLAFRNPCEVVASLQRRNSMSRSQAERLWLGYVRASLLHTRGHQRMFVFYEDIMNDAGTELARLATFIGRPDARHDPAVTNAAAEFLEDTLRHHRMSMEELAGDEHTSFPVKGLYLAIRGHAPRRTSSEKPRTSSEHNDAGDQVLRGTHATLDLLAERAVEAWDRAAEITAERDALASARHGQAEVIAQLTRTVTQLSDSIASLTIERDRLTADLQRATRDRASVAHERDAAFGVLHEIHTSTAWTLVARVRRVIVRLLPAGTRRRRTFDIVLRRIAPRSKPEWTKASAGSVAA